MCNITTKRSCMVRIAEECSKLMVQLLVQQYRNNVLLARMCVLVKNDQQLHSMVVGEIRGRMKYQMVRAHAMILSNEYCSFFNSLLHNLFTRSLHLYIHSNEQLFVGIRFSNYNGLSSTISMYYSEFRQYGYKKIFKFYNPLNFEYDPI